MKYTPSVLCFITLLATLLACKDSGLSTPSITPTPVVEAGLVGIWEGHYPSSPPGTEIIIFKSDGTYQQFYQNTGGYFYTGEGLWSLENLTSGRQRIRLEGALWFPLGPHIAELRGVEPTDHSQPHTFWDSDTLESVNMTTDLILQIIPSGNPKGFALSQYAYDIDSGMERLSPATH